MNRMEEWLIQLRQKKNHCHCCRRDIDPSKAGLAVEGGDFLEVLTNGTWLYECSDCNEKNMPYEEKRYFEDWINDLTIERKYDAKGIELNPPTQQLIDTINNAWNEAQNDISKYLVRCIFCRMGLPLTEVEGHQSRSHLSRIQELKKIQKVSK